VTWKSLIVESAALVSMTCTMCISTNSRSKSLASSLPTKLQNIFAVSLNPSLCFFMLRDLIAISGSSPCRKTNTSKFSIWRSVCLFPWIPVLSVSFSIPALLCGLLYRCPNPLRRYYSFRWPRISRTRCRYHRPLRLPLCLLPHHIPCVMPA
jgi:hypothetical protein